MMDSSQRLSCYCKKLPAFLALLGKLLLRLQREEQNGDLGASCGLPTGDLGLVRPLGKGRKNFVQKFHKRFGGGLLANGKRGQGPPGAPQKPSVWVCKHLQESYKQQAGGTRGNTGYLGLRTCLPACCGQAHL